MEHDSYEVFAEFYDPLYLKMKDYQTEAEKVVGVINEYEQRESGALLDVGCGTGEHLKYLNSDFQCTGIDINQRMIEMARKKVPNVKFKVANMVDFSLRDRFDVIISLFSSIGYVQTYQNLVKTLHNFHRHLKDKGLVIVEPWVFLKDFKEGYISLDTYEDDEVKFVRMARSETAESKWLVFMHYLIGKNGKIRHSEEVHEMLAVDRQDYIEAFEQSGLECIKYLNENLWASCRGLFLAIKSR
jgi:SAM-dependent methyltransferase